MTTPESNPLPPTELKSDEELAKQLTNDLFEEYVSDRYNDGRYTLMLQTKQMEEFFKDMGQRVTALISLHTGQLRQRIAELETKVAETESDPELPEDFQELYKAFVLRGDELTHLRDRLALVERERDEARDHDEAVCQTLEARSSMLSAEQDKSERYRLVTLKQDAELAALRQQAAKDGQILP